MGPQVTESIDSQLWAREYREKRKESLEKSSSQVSNQTQMNKKKIFFFVLFNSFFQKEVLEKR